MNKINWIVLIVREGVSEITPFEHYADAFEHYDKWGAQWTESYLLEVKLGPKV